MEVRVVAVVAGYVLKVLRESVGLTQAEMAAEIDVDLSTVQGWESGRRPLGAIRARQLVRLRARLALRGVSPAAVAQLTFAVEADEVLTAAIQAGADPVPAQHHSLAAVVYRRDQISLITWPFTGVTPPALRGLPQARRRGPVADRPLLSSEHACRFFDHMQTTADRSSGVSQSVLRRQATYLLGFDRRASSAGWLETRARAAVARASFELNVPAGIELRSLGLALARRGDPEPIRQVIDRTLSSDRHVTANLNYWAYWLGELIEPHADDAHLLATGAERWSGARVVDHLVAHLDDDHADLNVHSLWCLVRARPRLLGDLPALRRQMDEKVSRVDVDSLSTRARTEVAKLRAASELADR
ncbi:MAG: helix-turn-helix domain-containing protein [Dermatophilaceae bacterium]